MRTRRPVLLAAASLTGALALLGTACEPDTSTPPPTTAAPTTLAPTTLAPTTLAPTTLGSTTTRPSTTTTTRATTTTTRATTTTTAVPGGSTPAIGSCLLTPASSFWHANVQGLPVATGSATWIGEQSTRSLKADFGSGLWDGDKIGIPFNVVGGSQPKVVVQFGDYADESDDVPYPIPPNAQIEGVNSDGDRHVLVVDQDNCRLYETGNTYVTGGVWSASGGATWDLTSNAMRPLGWTSSDAAGLPILPGLVRYDEVASGSVNHAIRVTMPSTGNSYVWPASHKAKSGSSTLPMGSWIRLKPGTDLSRLDPAVRPIAVALQRYGGVVADNGSAFYMSGAPDERWDNDELQTLGNIKGSDFEVVDASSLMVSSTSYQRNGG